MIARVWGECAAADILFRMRADGLWEAVVPREEGGEYVVEVWAEDEAGNTSYLATLLFSVDPNTLSVRVSTLDVTGAISTFLQFSVSLQAVSAAVTSFVRL